MNNSCGNGHLLKLWEVAAPQAAARRSLCLLAGLSESSAAVGELPVGERDRRLFLVRKELFGDRIEGLTECPKCSARVELAFSASAFASVTGKRILPRPLISNGYEVIWRIPTSNDLADFADETVPSRIRERLLERCLVKVSYEESEVSPKDCPEDVIREVCEAMSQVDPFAETRLDLQCPECGTSWNAVFDIGAYLWREIDAWAKRILREIHLLASAYGWSEADILAMSPQRRRIYLELVLS